MSENTNVILSTGVQIQVHGSVGEVENLLFPSGYNNAPTASPFVTLTQVGAGAREIKVRADQVVALEAA
jgi:hypothetical protein